MNEYKSGSVEETRSERVRDQNSEGVEEWKSEGVKIEGVRESKSEGGEKYLLLALQAHSEHAAQIPYYPSHPIGGYV